MKIEVNVNLVEAEYRGTQKPFRTIDNRATIKAIQVEVPSKSMVEGNKAILIYVAEEFVPVIVDGKVKVYYDKYKNKWKFA